MTDATLWWKAGITFAAALAAMVGGVPLMTPADAAHGGHLVAADPFMQWVMRGLGPSLRAAMPWLYAVPWPVMTWALTAVTAALNVPPSPP